MTLKTGFLHEKKCTTSNIISLHDKNLDRAIEIGITFMHYLMLIDLKVFSIQSPS